LKVTKSNQNPTKRNPNPNQEKPECQRRKIKMHFKKTTTQPRGTWMPKKKELKNIKHKPKLK
jgi:hypothetical protein